MTNEANPIHTAKSPPTPGAQLDLPLIDDQPRAYELMQSKLGEEGLTLLNRQLDVWSELNEMPLHSPLRDALQEGRTELPKGTLLHGMGMHAFDVDALKNIAALGIVSGELRGIVEDGETHACADFFRVESSTSLDEYMSWARTPEKVGNFSSPRGERMLCGGVTFIVDPETEGVDELLIHDGYTDQQMGDFVHTPGRRTADNTAAILGAMPRGAIAGVIVPERYSEEQVESVKLAFPATPIFTSGGQLISSGKQEVFEAQDDTKEGRAESDLLIPTYEKANQLSVEDLDELFPDWQIEYPDTEPELLLFDVARTKEDHRLEALRHLPRAPATEGVERAIDQMPKEVGSRFQAHGIAGKYGSANTELNELLVKGIDPERMFYTTQLRYNPEAGAAIGADRPFTEGGIIVVGKMDKQVPEEGIKYVILGEQHLRVFDAMQERYPDVTFVPWHDAPSFFCELVNKKEETNYKPKPTDYANSYEPLMGFGEKYGARGGTDVASSDVAKQNSDAAQYSDIADVW